MTHRPGHGSGYRQEGRGWNAEQGGQRIPHPRRQSHADGRDAAALLDARVAFRGIARARRTAQEDPYHGRRPSRLPPDRWQDRHRRAALPSPWRQPLLRPQRELRAALLLPWLEVRRRRQLHRPADLTAGVGLQGHDQADRLSDARMGRHDLGLHGPARDDAGTAAARAGARARRLALRHQEVAGLQLGPEPRRRDRHVALLLPAQGSGNRRRGRAPGHEPRCPQRPGQARRSRPLGAERSTAALQRAGTRHRPRDRRRPQDRRVGPLLAHRPVPDAQSRLYARRFPG